VEKLLPIKAATPHPTPVTAPVDMPREMLLPLMETAFVRQIPLLDAHGVPVDVAIRSDFVSQAQLPLQAVVMAGGQGSRLRPLTENTPKPMLPVGGRPLMEFIVEQLRDVGVRNIHVTTHYQADKIMDHFGTGEAFGVDISYVQEEQPLGTGGALGLIKTPTEPVLIINGDILTRLDFQSFFAYHQEHRAEMTVGVRRYDIQVPYGVVECEGALVRTLREKPQLSFFVNAGIYLLEPSVFGLIAPNQHMNITDLLTRLVEANRVVVSYPICEYWLDIGQHADYLKAQEDATSGFAQAAHSGR
jgi:NDP-sugar pyrophosphorylase family protein